MTGEVWTFLGVVVASLLTFYGVLRKARADEHLGDRSASAAEVTALGARLDIAVARIDAHERTIRGLRDYIAADHAVHRAHDWPIVALPEELG